MKEKDILKETVDKFNNNFVTKFKGETDPEKILYFQQILDDPAELNKHLAEIPSHYAYWASMKRDAAQKLEDYKNFVSMWEQSKTSTVIAKLTEKGVKTPTQKAIDAELKLMYRDDEKYKQIQKKLKGVHDTYEKILVIEKAVLTKLDCLRIIANLTNGMMTQGIYVYKHDPKTKKGAF